MRGEVAEIWAATARADSRGNQTFSVDDGPPTYTVRAAFSADRSARAEVPGQQEIDVVRMIVPHDLPLVNTFARVRWRGVWWDVVAPPARRLGNRHTRHWTLTIRKRPDNGGLA